MSRSSVLRLAVVVVVATLAFSTLSEASADGEPAGLPSSTITGHKSTPAGNLTISNVAALDGTPGVHVVRKPITSYSYGTHRPASASTPSPEAVTIGSGGSNYLVYVQEVLDLYYSSNNQFICAFMVGAAWSDPTFGDVSEIGDLYVNGNFVAGTDTEDITYTSEETGCYGGTPAGSLWSADVSGAGFWPTVDGPVYAYAEAGGVQIQM